MNDQVLINLRAALLAAVAYCAGRGWFTPTDAGFATALITQLGPIFGPMILTWYSNHSTVKVPASSVAAKVAVEEAQPNSTPASIVQVAKVATAACVALLMVAFLMPGNARAQTIKKPLQITGNVISDLKANAASGTTPSQNVIALYEKLQAVSLVDLKYALNIATKKNNMAASQCWTAIITQIEQDQTANLDSNGQPIPTPDPHLFTDVERLSDVINSLGPNSPLMVGCGSFANQAKMNVLQLISTILAGGAGLAAFAP